MRTGTKSIKKNNNNNNIHCSLIRNIEYIHRYVFINSNMKLKYTQVFKYFFIL